MRKSILKLSVIVVSLVIFACSAAFANSVLLGVQVTMPTGTTINVKLVEIQSVEDDDDIWGTAVDITTGGGTANFDNHAMVATTDGVYLTGYYYALEIAPVGGGWSGSGITFTYSGGANNIGLHSTATLVECVYTGPTTPPDENDIAVYGLHQMNRTVPITSYEDGWMRIYLGLATGEEASGLGVTPFTAATPAGLYSGSLTISYTGA